MGTEKIKRTPQKPKERVRKPYVKKACIPCKSAHTACDSSRPCKRCTTLGIESECIDVERKKPVARKPRKKKNKIENQQTFPSLQEYLPFISPYNQLQLNQMQYQPIYTQYPINQYTNNANILPNEVDYYSIPNENQLTNIPYTNQMTLNNFKPNNINYNNNEKLLLNQSKEQTNLLQIQHNTNTQQKKDENYDVFMDLTNFTPNSPSFVQVEDISDQNEKKDNFVVESPLKLYEKEDEFEDETVLDLTKKNTEDDKGLQVIPFNHSNSNENSTVQQNMTNSQIQDMLKMVWEKQQNQSQEIQNLKDIVNDLKNLLISKKSKFAEDNE